MAATATVTLLFLSSSSPLLHLCSVSSSWRTLRVANLAAMGDYSVGLVLEYLRLLLLSCLLRPIFAKGSFYLELKQYDSAEKSYLASVDIDPAIRRSKSFKVAL
ncbi:Small glutamine-rich tetratricopeptide repeat-containing protein beta [Senna tora]|uniref:Small glutamine-rich tetratricopeptide repeat-containing protein beta n=1 Tax=Senna tora TaxID=362788 RepID=A0A834SEE2_9FABA|nr:Small glutamine-rich tetratricopeptide repeat-containing protein beta [Senna tora]